MSLMVERKRKPIAKQLILPGLGLGKIEHSREVADRAARLKRIRENRIAAEQNKTAISIEKTGQRTGGNGERKYTERIYNEWLARTGPHNSLEQIGREFSAYLKALIKDIDARRTLLDKTGEAEDIKTAKELQREADMTRSAINIFRKSIQDAIERKKKPL